MQVALATINWKQLQTRPQLAFSDCFPEIARPNSLQAATLEVIRQPGIYIIEAPMGSGKTEAALAATYELLAANQASGLYFALPTRTTSNRIHLRLRPFLDRISAYSAVVRLAHRASWLVEHRPPVQLSPAFPGHESDA